VRKTQAVFGQANQLSSQDIRSRERDALYRADEKALDRQLLMNAVPMAKALEEFLETSADDMTRRKASFMRRMRS
jgi:hypothetical protein